MEASKKKKNRRWVTRGIIAFVAILAVLTFFSNTVMNLTIPKVIGKQAVRGNLSYTNNATGTIESTDKQDVKGIEGRVVDQVLCTNYDMVYAGDTILTLREVEDTSTLDDLRNRLVALQREIEYADRTPAEVSDYTTLREAVNTAQENLELARQTLNAAQNRDAVIAAAQGIINENSPLVPGLEATVAAAAETVEDLQSQISMLQSEIDTRQEQIDTLVNLGIPTPTPTPTPSAGGMLAARSLDKAAFILCEGEDAAAPSDTQPSDTAPSDTQPSDTAPSDTQPSDTQPSDTQPSDTEPSETQPSETQPSETQPSETQPSETQPSETQPSETQPSETEPSQTQPSETQPSETQPSETVPVTNQSTDRIGQLRAEIEERQTQIDELSSQIADATARRDEASASLAAVNGAIEEAQAAIAAANELPSVSSAQSSVNLADSSLSSAQRTLNDTQINDAIRRDQAADSYNDKLDQIADLEEQIADLEAKMEIVEITAPISGYVFNMSVSSGDTLTKDGVVFTIVPEDSQYTVTFSFETAVANNFSIGMPLSCDLYWVDSVVITNIKPDPDSPRERRQVKCALTGSYMFPGEQITVVADRANKDYEHVIPSSAINEDNVGTFVYVIEESSSPLGDKYVVKRVDVTVEATDGALTAISGEGIDRGMIVTRSEEPLHDGDRVRLEDYS